MIKILLSIIIFFLSSSIASSQAFESSIISFPRFTKIEDHLKSASIHSFWNSKGLKSDELTLIKSFEDSLLFQHLTYQQYFQGIPIESALYTIHTKNNQLLLGSGELYKIKKINCVPTIDKALGFELAKSQLQFRYNEFPAELIADYESGQLVIFVDSHSEKPKAHLAYKYLIDLSFPIYKAEVFVDAHDGTLLDEHPLIHHNDVTLMGKSLYNGNVFLKGSKTQSSYLLESAKVTTYDLKGEMDFGSQRPVTNSQSVFLNNPIAVQAHFGAEQTLNYFHLRHQRDSYDNEGTPLLSFINYGQNYANAFWDGKRMVYGEGDGYNYGPVVSLDISAHEISHGVIDHSADLIYSRESGALNESFADIFGEMVEYYVTGRNDWLLGADIALKPYLSFRSMSNPNDDLDPDTYGGDHWYDPNCMTPMSTNDRCGVHINSGVQNKWFYILAMGERGVNDHGVHYNILGIGRNAAAAIAYRNLTVYLSPNSTFADARAGSIQAAIDLYGAHSTEVQATTDAWYAVGVGERYTSSQLHVQAEFVIEVNNLTSNSVNISWYGLTDSLLYKVYVNNELYASTMNQSLLIADLISGQDYRIEVMAVVDDQVEISSHVDITTLSSLPIKDFPLFLDSISFDYAAVHWSISPVESDLVYSVFLNGKDIDISKEPFYEFKDLTSDTEYDLWIEASMGNQSIISDTLKFRTLIGRSSEFPLIGYSFEDGLEGWMPNNFSSSWYQGVKSPEGKGSILIKGGNKDNNFVLSPIYDNFKSGTSVEVSFLFNGWSMEMGDLVQVSYSTGVEWNLLGTLNPLIDYFNGATIQKSYVIDQVEGDFIQLKFDNLGDSASDHFYLDQVFLTQMGEASSTFFENTVIRFKESDISPLLKIFPAIALENVSIEGPEAINRLLIFDHNGQLYTDHKVGHKVTVLNVSNFHSGIYYVIGIGERKPIIGKFIKS